MEIDYSTLTDLISSALLFTVVYILMYRKFFYSVVDPLFIFAITTAFASVLAIQIVPEDADVIHFFLCQLALWLGLFIAHNTFRIAPKKDNKSVDHTLSTFTDNSVLIWVTYILLGIFVISNLFIAYTKGFALFSDSPTEAKVANFQQGYGFFRKLNWGIGTFVITSLIFLYLITKRSLNLFFLVVVALFTAIDGSKSALAGVVVSASFLLYHPAFQGYKVLIKKFQRYLPFSILAVMSVFFTVLIKEKGSLDGALIGFFQRLFFSGDSLLYYYLPVNVDFFESYTPWDYISRVTNPILGFFRLQPYQEALGNIMVDNIRTFDATGVTIGPNTPFYIEGRIYFGYWGALPYCILVGFSTAVFRIYYFSIINTSAFYFVFISTFCQLSIAFITDVSMAISLTFNLFLFVMPVFVVVSLALKQKIVIKPVTFMNRPNASLR